MSVRRLQLTMQTKGGYSRSSIDEHDNGVHPVNSYIFQPQLVVPLPHGFPQTQQNNCTPSRSGNNIFHARDMLLSFSLPFRLLKIFNPKISEVIKH
jgi:hypothetical protein